MLKYLFIVALLVPTLSWAQTAPTEKLTLEEILRRNRIACGDSFTQSAKYVVFQGVENYIEEADTEKVRFFKFGGARGGYYYREYRERNNPKATMIAGFKPNSAWFWDGDNSTDPIDVDRDAALKYFSIEGEFGTFFSEENVKTFQEIELKGDVKFKGVDCFVIEYKKKGATNIVMVNKESFLINFFTAQVYTGGPNDPETLLIKFSDFRPTGYGMMAFKQEYFREKEAPYMVVIQTDYSISDTIDYSLFEKPVVGK